MDERSVEFLKSLLASPSPSGYERPIQDVVRRFAVSIPAEINTDWHGNVIAAVNPQGKPRIMLAGHCDQIGLMVKHIDDKGFVRVTAIGGWDTQMLLGQKLHIWTKSGPIRGVIARKPIHLLPQDERKTVPEMKDLWIDIAAASGEEAREAQAGIGVKIAGRRHDSCDPVMARTCPTRCTDLGNNREIRRSLDGLERSLIVMARLVRATYCRTRACIDGPDKPGHDGIEVGEDRA